jgi:hypothetical protein
LSIPEVGRAEDGLEEIEDRRSKLGRKAEVRRDDSGRRKTVGGQRWNGTEVRGQVPDCGREKRFMPICLVEAGSELKV